MDELLNLDGGSVSVWFGGSLDLLDNLKISVSTLQCCHSAYRENSLFRLLQESSVGLGQRLQCRGGGHGDDLGWGDRFRGRVRDDSGDGAGGWDTGRGGRDIGHDSLLYFWFLGSIK